MTLERAYRRLTLAYPREYREARGNEIVATLMDGAAPGQRHPRPREVVDVLAGGVRQRLGVGGSTGYADGLRTVLPVALGLATAMSAAVRVGGLEDVPTIQPYVYAWGLALVAWAIRPSAGRVLTVVAALFTLRIAAMWTYGFAPVFAVCLVGVVAAFAAVAAPPGPATMERGELGSALWSRSGRVLTMMAAFGLAAVGLIGPLSWLRLVTAGTLLAVLVLAVTGAVLAARRRGTSGLWAAALLLPAAVVLPVERWPYGFGWNTDERRSESRPWLFLRTSMGELAEILLPFLCAIALAAVLGASIGGAHRMGRAAATLTRSTLAGLALFVATAEAAAGVPSVAVLAGCVVLAAAALGAATLPRWVMVAALAVGASVVLMDISAPDRYGRPWPLYVLALLAALVVAQALFPDTRPRTTPTLVGTSVVFAVMAAYTLRAYDVVAGDEARFVAAEHHPLVLTAPAFVVGAIAAGLVSARAPVRAAVTALVGVGSLLLLAAPTPDPLVLGGMAVAGALVVALVGLARRRIGRVVPPAVAGSGP